MLVDQNKFFHSFVRKLKIGRHFKFFWLILQIQTVDRNSQVVIGINKFNLLIERTQQTSKALAQSTSCVESTVLVVLSILPFNYQRSAFETSIGTDLTDSTKPSVDGGRIFLTQLSRTCRCKTYPLIHYCNMRLASMSY